MRRWLAAGSAALLAACFTGPLEAQSNDLPPEVKATLKAMNQRLKEQDRRIKEQGARLAELEQSKNAATTLQGTLPGSAASEAAQREIIRQVVTQALMESKPVRPAWMENLKLAGDFRLRYESNNFNWGTKANAENIDRNRARFRLRFGLVKTWLDDQFEVGFRLASGSDNDANSTNQTFTQDFAKKPVWIDLAYAKYSPKEIKGLTIIGGKMIKPWAQNDIFWDTDVNPEGFWAEYSILDNLSLGVNCYLTQPIFSPTTTSGSSKYEDLTATLMFDLVWKF